MEVNTVGSLVEQENETYVECSGGMNVNEDCGLNSEVSRLNKSTLIQSRSGDFDF